MPGSWVSREFSGALPVNANTALLGQLCEESLKRISPKHSMLSRYTCLFNFKAFFFFKEKGKKKCPRNSENAARWQLEDAPDNDFRDLNEFNDLLPSPSLFSGYLGISCPRASWSSRPILWLHSLALPDTFSQHKALLQTAQAHPGRRDRKGRAEDEREQVFGCLLLEIYFH